MFLVVGFESLMDDFCTTIFAQLIYDRFVCFDGVK